MGVAQGSAGHPDHHRHPTPRPPQSQLDSFIEKWKGEGVNASPRRHQRVGEAVRREDQGGDAQRAAAHRRRSTLRSRRPGRAPPPGRSPTPTTACSAPPASRTSEQWQSPRLQQCVKTYEDASGQAVIGPDELKPGPDGKRAASSGQAVQRLLQRAGHVPADRREGRSRPHQRHLAAGGRTPIGEITLSRPVRLDPHGQVRRRGRVPPGRLRLDASARRATSSR